MSKSPQTTPRFQHWKQAFPGKCKGGTTHRRDWYVGEGHCSEQVRVFRVFQCDRDLRETKQQLRILRIRCYSQFKASFSSFQGTPDISSGISQEKNVLNRTMKLSSSFVQFQGTSEYFPQCASQSGEVLGIMKQFTCGDEQRYRGHRSDRVGAQEDV